MTVEVGKHHLVLYALLAIATAAGAGIFHQWRLDIETAKVKADAQEQIIKAADLREADRQKQFEQTVKSINLQRVPAKTPPAELVKKLQGLEPEMSVLPDQLVAPKPDAPKVNLSLTPAQQVTLDNRLADCKICDAERAKLRTDLGDERAKLGAMTKERDDWIQAAKGGSLWTRVKRRGWHFVEDAIVIEGARCVAGHC